jgi:hypothetical protein
VVDRAKRHANHSKYANPTPNIPQRKLGKAITKAPTPAAHKANNRLQPTGTASTNDSAPRKPRLAAKAVESVVLGPGVKLAAVAKPSKAVSSAFVMPHNVAFMIHTPAIQTEPSEDVLYGDGVRYRKSQKFGTGASPCSPKPPMCL